MLLCATKCVSYYSLGLLLVRSLWASHSCDLPPNATTIPCQWSCLYSNQGCITTDYHLVCMCVHFNWVTKWCPVRNFFRLAHLCTQLRRCPKCRYRFLQNHYLSSHFHPGQCLVQNWFRMYGLRFWQGRGWWEISKTRLAGWVICRLRVRVTVLFQRAWGIS